MAKPTVGSLFSGIGGLDLGLERAGFEVIWKCEINPFARRVLAKHWPGIPCYEDVREIDGSVERPDLICGGFPCQDISVAGRRAGIDGERSGLWSEYLRIIRVLRPRFVLVENVAALLIRGMDRVLGDLAESRFDAEWTCVAAEEFGSPQKRERVFIVAYPCGQQCPPALPVFHRDLGQVEPPPAWQLDWVSRLERGHSGRVWRVPDPGIHGVAHGVPVGLDRIRTLGNAVVPQVAEWLGRQILGATGLGNHNWTSPANLRRTSGTMDHRRTK